MPQLTGDFTDNDWLLLVEDNRGTGRVLGYFVFTTEEEAQDANRLVALADALGLYEGGIPDWLVTEILTYGDFRASYGNRMPLAHRMTT